MRVKAIASFFHGGSRKVGDEFEVSDHAGGLLKAKGLVSLGADVELNTSWTSPNAADGLGDGSKQVADSDTEVETTSGAADQGQAVADANAATNEGGQPAPSPADDGPADDSHQGGSLGAGLGAVSGTLEQSPVVADADAGKEGKAVVESAQAELVPVSAKSGKADAGKTKRSE